MDAPEVVEAGSTGLDRNKAVVVPGLVNKLGAISAPLRAALVVRKIAGAIKY